MINKIWDVSLYTTKLCMHQYYEDGVKRDGLLWVGDYRVQFLCNLFCFGDFELARKSLFMIASSQRMDGAIPACAAIGGGHQHPENIDYMPGVPFGFHDRWIILNYCIDFVSSVKEYVAYSGDLKTLEQLWDFVQRNMEYLVSVTNEFVLKHDTFDAKGIDTTIITDTRFDYTDGWWYSESAYLIQLYWGIQDFEKLSKMVSEQPEIEEIKKYGKYISKLIFENYFDNTREIFTDFNLKFGNQKQVSWNANAFSVLSNLVSPLKGKEIFNRLETEKEAWYPIAGFMKFWVLESMFKTGKTQEALREIRNYWGFMIENDASTFWDICDPVNHDKYENDLFAYSKCHGWSAGCAYLLPVHVLGINDIDITNKKIIIKPNLGDLSWAEGTVPTLLGDVFVHWEVWEELSGYVILPEDVMGEVHIQNTTETKTILLRSGHNTIN